MVTKVNKIVFELHPAVKIKIWRRVSLIPCKKTSTSLYIKSGKIFEKYSKALPVHRRRRDGSRDAGDDRSPEKVTKYV
jgi:hypothetical protein